MAGKVKKLLVSGVIIGLLSMVAQTVWTHYGPVGSFTPEPKTALVDNTESEPTRSMAASFSPFSEIAEEDAPKEEMVEEPTLAVVPVTTEARADLSRNDLDSRSFARFTAPALIQGIEAEEEPLPAVPELQGSSPSAIAGQNEPEPEPEPAPVATAPASQPEKRTTPADVPQMEQATVTYITHIVVKGDTLWNIGLQYGVQKEELFKLNNMGEHTPLTIGMSVTVPVYNIPVKTTAGPQYGELLDWWNEAQYVWPMGQDARVVDFYTGKSFMVRRSFGANHADVEPLTAQDTRIMKEIWGEQWSWNTRPVILEVGGRRLAASANGMPHSISNIKNNDFNGHFCIHFLNSTRHVDGKQQADHQSNVRIAAGQ